jgi:hypothetical protein
MKHELHELRLLGRNLEALLRMCQRHPAHLPALIAEIENKLEVRHASVREEPSVTSWRRLILTSSQKSGGG